MKILDRDEAYGLWDTYWRAMSKEWFKIEVLQDYTGEDDCPSLRAWLAGDKQQSLALLQSPGDLSWAKACLEKHAAGIPLRRIRIIDTPYTPYTEWEIEFYKRVNEPSGEQIFVVDASDAMDLAVPAGDLMMFDNKRVVICGYDVSGRVTHQTFYDENDDSTAFLQLKHQLLALARPLQDL